MQKIWQDDFYLGAALNRIVEHHSFKALNKADKKYGHFLVNTDRRVMMKRSTAESHWQFTFLKDDLATLAADLALPCKTYLVLVCGDKTFCLLGEEQFTQLIDLTRDNQRIVVDYEEGHSLRVTGSRPKVKLVVHHNAFPNGLFA